MTAPGPVVGSFEGGAAVALAAERGPVVTAKRRSSRRRASRLGPAMEKAVADSHSVRRVLLGHVSMRSCGTSSLEHRAMSRPHAGWTRGSPSPRQPLRGQLMALTEAAR